MGGLDLYVSRRMPDGNWGKPENLGYPINTFKDESGLIVNSKGEYAYFSSDREGTAGCEDIYMFELPKSAQPVQVTYMKGKVFNKRTTKPLSASFELIDLETGTVVAASMSDPVSGEFLVCIPVNKNYALNVSSPGYLFYSETFQLKASEDPWKPVRMDVPMQPIEPGVTVDLKNVFFETGKFDLRPESKAELDKLIAFLTANPNIRAELSGHTDNVGSPTANLTLSQNRAKAVVDYLVAGGIDASRLTSKGYGDTKPKVPNDTPENRQKNRRTEFTVISN
jgi:outer membrane protein OmpA-like peptidoglycan-associated protein